VATTDTKARLRKIIVTVGGSVARDDVGDSLPRVRGRLRSGELRALVAEALGRRPDLAYTPTQLSNMLGRSAGAIANALNTLCERGVAVRTQDTPKTYTAATARRRKAARTARGPARR